MLRIAGPLILSTASWSIQHFLDRMFLAWYSSEAVAAALPAGILCFVFISFFLGTGSYCNAFVAQYTGADRPRRVGAVIGHGIWFALGAGVIIAGLIPLGSILFTVIGHHPEVIPLETTYFRISCLGGGPVVLGAVLAAFFTGRGKTWPVMWVNFIGTAVNVTLNYLLIFGKAGFPEMGIAGAAWGTVIGESTIPLIYAALMIRRKYRNRFGVFASWRLEKDLMLRLLRYGGPNGLQFMLDMASFTTFILIVGRLGKVELAASNIAFGINALAFVPMIGMAMATSTLVGQWLGRNRPEIAARAAWSACRLALVYTGLAAGLFIVFPQWFIRPFAAGQTEDFAAMSAMITDLLKFIAVYAIFDAVHLVFSGAVKGAGDTRYVMVATVIISWTVLVIPTWLACMVFGKSLYWAWTFAATYAIGLGVMFLLRFLGGKWKKMRVIEAE